MNKSLLEWKGKEQIYQFQQQLEVNSYLVKGKRKEKLYILKQFQESFFHQNLEEFVNDRIKNQPKYRTLIKFYEWFEVQSFVYLIQEYCGSNSVAKILLQYVPDSQKRDIILNVGSQLEVLHQLGYAYGDLQASNIFQKELQRETQQVEYFYQLCEFGQLIKITTRQKSKCSSAVKYIKISQILQKQKSFEIQSDLSIDIRKFGTLIYQLYTNTTLSENASSHIISEKIAKNIEQGLQSFLIKMFHFKPNINEVNLFFKKYFITKISLTQFSHKTENTIEPTYQTQNLATVLNILSEVEEEHKVQMIRYKQKIKALWKESQEEYIKCRSCCDFESIQMKIKKKMYQQQNQQCWTEENENDTQKLIQLRNAHSNYQQLLEKFRSEF